MVEHRETTVQDEAAEQRVRSADALASPEFFYLLQRIEQVKQQLEQKIIHVEQKLEQKIIHVEKKLEQRINR